MWSQKLISSVAEIKPSYLDINDGFVGALDKHGRIHVFDATAGDKLHTCDIGSLVTVTACALRPPHVLLGTEAGVEMRTLQDDLPDGPLTRFTAHVTCISAAPNGRFVAIGSADFTAKIVGLDDGDCYAGEVTVRGHAGPLLCAALDPEGEFLATAACDGTARLWLAASGKQLRSWTVGKACADTALSEDPCPLAWEPLAGRVLALPVASELRLLARGNAWPVSATCTSDQLRGAVTCCVWSPEADFVAAGSRDGAVCAWSIAWSDDQLREATLRQASPYFALRSPGLCPLRQLWWRKAAAANQQQQPSLVYLDAKGDLRVAEVRKNCSVRQQQQQQQKQPAVIKKLADTTADAAAAAAAAAAASLAEAELEGIDPRDLVEEFEVELEAAEAAAFAAKATSSATATTANVRKASRVGDDSAELSDGKENDTGEEGTIDEDDKAKQKKKDLKKQKQKVGNSSDSDTEDSDAGGGGGGYRRQRPIQPGSTSGCPRYLLWNRIGCVVESPPAMPEQPRLLSVEFHDTGVHHGLLIPNSAGFTLAALSRRLLALSAPATDTALGFLRVRLLGGAGGGAEGNGDSGGGGGEWTQGLPRGEDTVCLAVSETWIVVGTDRRAVRLWSSHGLQLAVLSCPGPALAVSAWPAGFALLYGGGGREEDSSACADVYEVPTSGWPVPALVRPAVPVPTAARSAIAWLGHCQQTGALCVQDSRGLLRALLPDRWVWTPLLNGRALVPDRTDWLWPVGVSLAECRVAAVHCRNADHPTTQAPRPPVRYYPLAPLVCEGPLAELEAQLMLAQVAAAAGAISGLGELQLRLFALAVKSGEEGRAAEAAGWMDERVLRLALQFAVKARRPRLADRLTAMGEALMAASAAAAAAAGSKEKVDGGGGGGAAEAAQPLRQQQLPATTTAVPRDVIQPTPVKRRKRESLID